MKEKPDFIFTDCADPFAPELTSTKTQKVLTIIFLYSIVAIMVGILLYSLILNILAYGILSLLKFGFPLFSVFTASLIMIVSAHGKWGVFIRWATKNKQFTGKDFNAEHYEKLYDNLEQRKLNEENAIFIVKDILYLKIAGRETEFAKSEIEKISINLVGQRFFVDIMADKKIREFPFPLPKKLLKKFLKQFNCIIETKISEPPLKTTQKKTKRLYSESDSAVSNSTGGSIPQSARVGIGAFLLIPIILGAVLVVLSLKNILDVPVFLGAFFFFGGLVAFIGAVFSETQIKSTIIGLLFGCAFIVFSGGLTIYFVDELSLNGILSFFVNDPNWIVLIMFMMLGAMFVVLSIAKLVKTILTAFTKQ